MADARTLAGRGRMLTADQRSQVAGIPALQEWAGSRPQVEQLPDRALEFCLSPQHFLLNLARAGGPAARFRLTNESFAILSDPDAVHAVFNGSQDEYEKGE